MYRLMPLGARCLLLGGCVYYPYGYRSAPPPAYAYPAPVSLWRLSGGTQQRLSADPWAQWRHAWRDRVANFPANA